VLARASRPSVSSGNCAGCDWPRLAMRSRRRIGSAAVGLSLLLAPTLARAQEPHAASAASERSLSHVVLLGVGATWTEPGEFQHTTHPGAMLGFDLALGRHAALGLIGDFTYIDERPDGPPPTSTNHRVILGLDLKVLPPLERGRSPLAGGRPRRIGCSRHGVWVRDRRRSVFPSGLSDAILRRRAARSLLRHGEPRLQAGDAQGRRGVLRTRAQTASSPTFFRKVG